VRTRDPCQLLPWDSDFFDVTIARVRLRRLGPRDVSNVATWCRCRRVDCAYFLAPGEDAATSRRAEEAGYHLTGVRVSLSVDLRSLPPRRRGEGVRFRGPADIEPISLRSRKAFHDSRFYFDGNFPQDRCDALYETWARKSCAGWADAVPPFTLSRQPQSTPSVVIRTIGPPSRLDHRRWRQVVPNATVQVRGKSRPATALRPSDQLPLASVLTS